MLSMPLVLKVNKAFSRITGDSRDELRGKPLGPMMALDGDGSAEAALRAALSSHGFWEGEVGERRKSGQVLTGWLNISSITNSKNHLSYEVDCLYDITINEATQDQISQLAYFDSLTLVEKNNEKNYHYLDCLCAVYGTTHGQYGKLIRAPWGARTTCGLSAACPGFGYRAKKTIPRGRESL